MTSPPIATILLQHGWKFPRVPQTLTIVCWKTGTDSGQFWGLRRENTGWSHTQTLILAFNVKTQQPLKGRDAPRQLTHVHIFPVTQHLAPCDYPIRLTTTERFRPQYPHFPLPQQHRDLKTLVSMKWGTGNAAEKLEMVRAKPAAAFQSVPRAR